MEPIAVEIASSINQAPNMIAWGVIVRGDKGKAKGIYYIEQDADETTQLTLIGEYINHVFSEYINKQN